MKESILRDPGSEKTVLRRSALFLFLAALVCNPYLGSFLFGNLQAYIVLIYIFECSLFFLSLLFLLTSLTQGNHRLGQCLRNFTVSFATLVFLASVLLGIEVGLNVYINNVELDIHHDDRIAKNIIFPSDTFLKSRKNDDKSYRSYYVNTNKEGFRSPPFEKNKTNAIRIVTLGGSTMWGYDVSDNHTIPAFLKEKFDRAGILIEIFNLGLNSSTISEQLKYLQKYFDKIQPDIVILYCGVNELTEAMAASPVTIFQKFLLERYYISKLILFTASRMIESPILTMDVQSRIQEGALSFRNSHNIYEKLCSKERIWCFTFFQPMIFHKNEKTFYEKILVSQKLFESRWDIFYDDYLNECLRGLSKSSSDKIIDLRGIFSNNASPLYTDAVHVNFVGNNIIAARMYDEIQKNTH